MMKYNREYDLKSFQKAIDDYNKKENKNLELDHSSSNDVEKLNENFSIFARCYIDYTIDQNGNKIINQMKIHSFDIVPKIN